MAKNKVTKTLKEKKFYDSLRDIFVGAKVEGESGYINLMRIKSRYYTEGVFPRLKQDIEESLEKAFRVFERQSEVDYFINKNAKAFLQEQFNL